MFQGVMDLSGDIASYRNYKLYLHNNLKQRAAGIVKYESSQVGHSSWVSKCRLHGKVIGVGLDRIQRNKAETAAAFAAMKMLGYAVQREDVKKVYGAEGYADFNKTPQTAS